VDQLVCLTTSATPLVDNHAYLKNHSGKLHDNFCQWCIAKNRGGYTPDETPKVSQGSEIEMLKELRIELTKVPRREGNGQVCPLPSQLGGLGERCQLPSGIPGQSPGRER